MYPMGFSFPLQILDMNLAIVEVSREAATLLMLVCIGWISGTNRNTRLAWFLYTFAIWDIFYYVFLKVFLNWPESIFTWDVLFLIPVMWVGPVWSPIVLSLTMIILAIVLLKVNIKGVIPLRANIWIMILGTIVCIFSFCLDPIMYLNTLPSANWHDASAIFDGSYVPIKFPLWIFVGGFITILVGIGRYVYLNSFSNNQLMRSQLL
jgi:hypothetical protein